MEVGVKLQSSFIRISPVMCKSTAGDSVIECVERETRESIQVVQEEGGPICVF